VRCDVVDLYHGGLYHLYKYRRYQDVRLVFAPEKAIAFFGGDPDNFEFPRFDLDVTYLRVYLDGAPLDTRALRNEAAVLLMAGHETTANTLAWTWYILSQMPEVEATLHAEVDRVLGGRLPTLADVPKLVYTRAVFEEVLRLYPPVPLLTREALRDEQFHTCRIPKGSLIVVCPWLLHRHHLIWPKPDHFIPGRFLPGGFRPTSKFAYIPFSVGPRICTGMAFGLTEAILSIATIAQNFMLRLAPGHRVEVSCRLTLRPGEKLPMQLVPRHAVEGAAVLETPGSWCPSPVSGCRKMPFF